MPDALFDRSATPSAPDRSDAGESSARLASLMRTCLWLTLLLASAAVWWPMPAQAARIKEVAAVADTEQGPRLVGMQQQ